MNPRAAFDDNTISSRARYDHFDTTAYSCCDNSIDYYSKFSGIVKWKNHKNRKNPCGTGILTDRGGKEEARPSPRLLPDTVPQSGKGCSDSLHGLPEVSLIGEDLLLVGILLLGLGPLDDGGQDHHVHHQCHNGDHALGGGIGGGGPDGGVHKAVGIDGGDGGEHAVVLEQGEHLGKHAPQGQGVGPVLDPAALVPEVVGKGGGQQQGQAAVPGVRGQAVVGILEVPQVIGQDVAPGHVGPQHVLLILGGVNAPPGGHAEDVDDTCNAVDPVPPAAVQPHVFGGQPPAVAELLQSRGAVDGGLKVAGHGDENVDGHDGKGEHLEPFGLADAPLVLEHHEADAPGGGGIELGIVEPAVHIGVGLVVQGPFRAGPCADGDGDEIHRQRSGQHQKADDAAGFGAAGEFVGQYQPGKHQHKAQKLIHGGFAVDLE